ncbi:MAG: DUF1738 domain-containing protein [Pseudomonadales bacterium]|nr:DUF1738 domain-containing protein [Pseudomonadales bacterium]
MENTAETPIREQNDAKSSDFYAEITNEIIGELEQGTPPWHKPWSDGELISRPRRHTGEPYQGINVLALWNAAIKNGYSSPYWMTYRQAQELGAQVKRGAKPQTVVFAMSLDEKDEEGATTGKTFTTRKSYKVFNADQIMNLGEHFNKAEQPLRAEQRILVAEAFFNATGANVEHGGEMAFYVPTTDQIQLPPFENFESPESYYATRAHETAHWTGHSSRLDREFGQSRSDIKYAQEELVAELSSAFLCADLGLKNHPRTDHSAYIQSWLKILWEDKKAIFTAATQAERAVKFLNVLQRPKPAPNSDTLATPAVQPQ